MERINNPSLEFLLGLKHGQKVNVSINGAECEAIVSVDEERIYLCQNEICGASCFDKMGKEYSWLIYNRPSVSLDIKWIELVEDCIHTSETSVTIPTEETIDFDEYDLLAIEFIKLAMK